MQAHRVMGAHPLEHVAVVAAGAEVVFAVDLDPAERGPRFQECAVMRGPQPDAFSQLLFSMASLPGLPSSRLPPIFTHVPALTILKSFGS